MNWRKTKVMRVAMKSEDCEVKIGDEVIDQVEEMKYLGVIISSDGRMKKEVEARITWEWNMRGCSNEQNSVEEEGTEQEFGIEIESGECDNDLHINAWL